MFRNMVRALATTAVVASTLSAQQIVSPDASYLSSTTKFDMSSITQFDSFTSLVDGGLTLTFGTALQKRALNDGWATWSQVPESEYAPGDPVDVGYCPGCTSLRMTLSSTVSIFGFEAQPNPFTLNSFTANFYNGASLVGSVTRDVDGNGGARLFAYQNAGGIDAVEFISTNQVDFAGAAFRYGSATVVPEPSTYALMGMGLLGVVGMARRRRVN